ncbi:Aminopeptidase S (Leu, Val, Phe, Tyr preference) [Brachybacterium faecium]|nr:Aminopeptidase S (Leu, Val, Phe, Tyr preference) [Brachybacterium faecium]
MKNFNEKLQKYAELAVKVGVNVQPEQKVYLTVNIENIDVAHAITAEAYKAGASEVIVKYVDSTLARMKYDNAPLSIFEQEPTHYANERIELANENACFISIAGQDPDLLNGVDAKKIAAGNKATGKVMQPFLQLAQSDKIAWTVLGAPTKGWAAKVFPDLAPEEQIDALWEAIFKTMRLDNEDHIGAWYAHEKTLTDKAAVLNDLHFESLHYTAPGTDLTVGLPKKHLWVAAGSENAAGTRFTANLPTEEVFSAAEKTAVNGVVSSTKPLSYGGAVIDGFKLTFKDGRITEVTAERGEEVLKHLIDSDEAAKYIGEVALVPHPSPISQSGVLYYTTLFDENAANHFAIGSAYAFNIDGGKDMTTAELEAEGINQGPVHVDFMVGSGEMDIDGVQADGTVVPVFRNGDWAI